MRRNSGVLSALLSKRRKRKGCGLIPRNWDPLSGLKSQDPCKILFFFFDFLIYKFIKIFSFVFSSAPEPKWQKGQCKTKAKKLESKVYHYYQRPEISKRKAALTLDSVIFRAEGKSPVRYRASVCDLIFFLSL